MNQWHHSTGQGKEHGTDKGRWQRGRSHVEDTADCSLSCWGRGSEQPCAGHESQRGWTKHQGSRQTRVSIQESNKSGKLGEQLDGSMKYRQAENRGDCPHTGTVSREKGQRQRQPEERGQECSTHEPG